VPLKDRCHPERSEGSAVVPHHIRFDQLCEKISATLTGAGITPKALLATLPETRQRVFERRYGVKDSAVPSSGPKLEERRRK